MQLPLLLLVVQTENSTAGTSNGPIYYASRCFLQGTIVMHN